MSSSLLWEPVINRGKSLSTSLKLLLRKNYRTPIDTILDSSHIPYLTGLKDASDENIGKEIQGLIKAIDDYDEIKIWEQF